MSVTPELPLTVDQTDSTKPLPGFDLDTPVRAELVCLHCGSRELYESQATRRKVVAFTSEPYGFETVPLEDADVLDLGYECGSCGRELTQETLIPMSRCPVALPDTVSSR